MNNKINYNKLDESLVLEFSNKFKFSNNLIKYQDDLIYDMYDHNYFYFKKEVTPYEIYKAIDYQKKNHLDFLKLYSENRLNKKIVKEFGLDENCYVTMLYEGKHNEFKTNNKVLIKDIKLNDLNKIELKHYEKIYGGEFIRKKNKAYLNKCKENNNFKYYGAYLNDKIVGACYAYTYKGYTCFDDLIVDNRHRHKYIASTLIKYIIDNSKHVLLHADLVGTPIKIYKKKGFKIVAKNYEYFSKIK